VEVLVECCAGIDIGKDEVVACVRGPGTSGRGRRKQTRTFSSFTASLEAMADWFTAEGVTEVAMDATGSYWKPVWYVLEERAFALKLVNAHHVKILPGRKSDVLRGNGWPSCSNTACCAAASCPRPRSASCGT
jgi:transposase